MSGDWIWSVILSVVGITGFVLAGQKVWWAWFINFFCQFLWLAYAVITEQWGFILAACVYMIVFGRNAVKWTDQHYKVKATERKVREQEAARQRVREIEKAVNERRAKAGLPPLRSDIIATKK